MDRGAWWATVHGITELDTTERLTLSHTHLRPTDELTASENIVCYLEPPRGRGLIQHGTAAQEAERARGRCGSDPSQGFSIPTSRHLSSILVSIALSLREQDHIPDLCSGPSFILSWPLAPEPPNLGEEPGRLKLEGRKSRVFSFMLFWTPCSTWQIQPLYVGHLCINS